MNISQKGLVAKRTKMFEGDRNKLDHIFKEYRHICREDRSDITIDENSTAPVNIEKNRYPDVLVIKNTAVKLEEIQGVKGSDYINANFVKDVTNSKRKQLYICCQAPLSSTFNDFWRMAWEQHSPAIVMITNLVEKNRVKADPYWPTRVGETLRYGNICVKLTREQTRGSNITVRTLKMWQSPNAIVVNKDDESVTPIVSDDDEVDDSLCVTDDEHTISDEGSSEDTDLQPTEDQEVRKIFQLHCTEWPDFGVPKSTQVMKDLIAEVDIRKKSLDDPIVVHCSAGIGRTGTFVAIHMSLQKDLHGEEIDIKDTVRHLRSQRLGMVQSKEQYMFVYSVVADMVRERKENSLSSTGDRRRTCTPSMFKQMMKEAQEIWGKDDDEEWTNFYHSHPAKPSLKRVWTSDNRTEEDHLVPPPKNKYKSDGENRDKKKERKKILHKEDNSVIKQKSHPQLRVSAVRKKLNISTYVNDEEQILKIQVVAPVEIQKKLNPT